MKRLTTRLKIFAPFMAVLIILATTPSFVFKGIHSEGENTQMACNGSSSREIMDVMKKVADWQLNNPVRFDIVFQNQEGHQVERVRMLWDGEPVLRHPRNFNIPSTSLPESWLMYAKITHDDASFCELTEAAQNSVVRELSIDPSQILQIRMEYHSSVGWEQGALYAGMYALYETTGEPVYLEALETICGANHWKLGPRIFHADDHCVGHLYLDLYRKYRSTEMVADVQMRFDWIMAHPSGQGISIKDGRDRWTWCDALFMSPPVWAKLSAITGNREYIDFMDKEWWETTEHLYDKDEKLFFRDDNYFKRKETNGEKVFWSRGNGWVLAGLARVLEEMPAEYESRGRYEELFKNMAARIAALQHASGLWRPSLLDPESYTYHEASSSGFFCYAFAWGVNNGLLDRDEYLPVIRRAWEGLNKCILPDGKLGWVQLPGASPGKVEERHTASYGVGAFLLAGSEVVKLFN
jgi:unsaturated rhamnogalacturonyl hydrolase